MLLLLQVLVSVHGNSATATKLQKSRTITLSGDVSGSASFDGSKNVSMNVDLANIAVLTGTISGSGTHTMISKNISYPSGYNNNNCVVVSAMAHNNTNETGAMACGSIFEASSFTTGAIPLQVILSNDDITIRGRNVLVYDGNSTMVPNIDGTFTYKIVLMKI